MRPLSSSVPVMVPALLQRLRCWTWLLVFLALTSLAGAQQLTYPACTNNTMGPPTQAYSANILYLQSSDPFYISHNGSVAYGATILQATFQQALCEAAHFAIGLYSAANFQPGSTTNTFTPLTATNDTVTYAGQNGGNTQVLYIPFKAPVPLLAVAGLSYHLFAGFQDQNTVVYANSSGYDLSTATIQYSYANNNLTLPGQFTANTYFFRTALDLVLCPFTATPLVGPDASCFSSSSASVSSSTFSSSRVSSSAVSSSARSSSAVSSSAVSSSAVSSSARSSSAVSSSAVSSSAQSSSVFSSSPTLSSSAAVTSPIAPSTGNGAAYSDPYFSGFWHQVFYIHGRAGEVYSILSDASLQLNARLVFLANISCPVLTGPSRVHCSDHPGTYFGEMALTTRSGAVLRLQAGEVSAGFSSVTLDGVEVREGDTRGQAMHSSTSTPAHGGTVSSSSSSSDSSDGGEVVDAGEGEVIRHHSPQASHPARSSLFVHRTSARSVVVHAGLYELLIENSDRYVDLVCVTVTDWTALMEQVRPEGLMGATWNSSAPMPPEEEQYRERDGDMLGCNMEKNRFCLQEQE